MHASVEEGGHTPAGREPGIGNCQNGVCQVALGMRLATLFLNQLDRWQAQGAQKMASWGSKIVLKRCMHNCFGISGPTPHATKRYASQYSMTRNASGGNGTMYVHTTEALAGLWPVLSSKMAKNKTKGYHNTSRASEKKTEHYLHTRCTATGRE